MTALRGSCLCGGVRFEIDGPLMRSSHCHCRQCQKAHGAPFRTRARVAAADFRFLAAEELVSFYELTPGTHRGFCKVCGSPVLVKFEDHSRFAGTKGNEQAARSKPHAANAAAAASSRPGVHAMKSVVPGRSFIAPITWRQNGGSTRCGHTQRKDGGAPRKVTSGFSPATTGHGGAERRPR